MVRPTGMFTKGDGWNEHMPIRRLRGAQRDSDIGKDFDEQESQSGKETSRPRWFN